MVLFQQPLTTRSKTSGIAIHNRPQQRGELILILIEESWEEDDAPAGADRASLSTFRLPPDSKSRKSATGAGRGPVMLSLRVALVTGQPRGKVIPLGQAWLPSEMLDHNGSLADAATYFLPIGYAALADDCRVIQDSSFFV